MTSYLPCTAIVADHNSTVLYLLEIPSEQFRIFCVGRWTRQCLVDDAPDDDASLTAAKNLALDLYLIFGVDALQ